MTLTDPSLSYVHVDVFSSRPYSDNSLAVLTRTPRLGDGALGSITQEPRHFETIFLETGREPDTVQARVFDLVGELDFAGHPLPGAAAVLHGEAEGRERRWVFELKSRRVEVTTIRRDGFFEATLEQGRAEWLGRPPAELQATFTEHREHQATHQELS